MDMHMGRAGFCSAVVSSYDVPASPNEQARPSPAAGIRIDGTADFDKALPG
jgi:hypothetical protein